MKTILSIDRAGGKFESWYYINGIRKAGPASHEFRDVVKWAENIGFIPRPTKECFISLIPSDQWGKIMSLPNDIQIVTINKIVDAKMGAFMTIHPHK